MGSNHGSLARARARGAGSHTDRRTTATRPRALSDPDDEGHGVGRGGEDKDGDRRQKPPGQPGPAGRACPRNYSPVRREGGGTRTVVRGKGEGGGGQRETGTKIIRRGTKSVSDSLRA